MRMRRVEIVQNITRLGRVGGTGCEEVVIGLFGCRIVAGSVELRRRGIGRQGREGLDGYLETSEEGELGEMGRTICPLRWPTFLPCSVSYPIVLMSVLELSIRSIILNASSPLCSLYKQYARSNSKSSALSDGLRLIGELAWWYSSKEARAVGY